MTAEFAPQAVANVGISFRASGSGAAVVFLHGVGLNKEIWRPQESFLSSRRTAIVCDLPGHGESPPPPQNPTLADYSAPILSLLDELEFASADIVGHSFGGFVALDFALRNPARTRKIAVFNGVFCRSLEAKKTAMARADSLAKNGAMDSIAMEKTLNRWFGEDADDSHQRAQIRAWLAAANAVGYARAYRLFAECDSAFANRLADLPMPALFATGELDMHSTPEMSRKMAQFAPNGICEIFPGQRHLAAFVSPEKANSTLLKFLESDE